MTTPGPAAHAALLAQRHGHLCPWWLGWALASPIRRLLDDPVALSRAFLAPGDRVLELGPGPGFFTIAMAEWVGPGGKVVCVDVQQRMLDQVARRAARRGLSERVVTRGCSPDGGLPDLGAAVDKAVLIHVLHEVPDPRATLAAVRRALKPGGRLLLVEPKGHCSPALFAAELWAAEQAGFSPAPEGIPAALGKRQAAVLGC